MQNIIHICGSKAWNAAVESGSYQPDSLESEGFIHCSCPDQVLDVANTFYCDQHDLVLLVIDPQQVRADIIWENPAGSTSPRKRSDPDVFPHIYGPLNLDAVTGVLDFRRKPEGGFSLPAGI
jgi:uncharacterized protein (DUF952 family)